MEEKIDPKDWRMDAYYYGFDRTGVDEIDLILSALACAGKAYHHTEDWNENAYALSYHEGDTPVDWIQNAANKAAESIRRKDRDGNNERKSRLPDGP